MNNLYTAAGRALSVSVRNATGGSRQALERNARIQGIKKYQQ